MSPVPTDRGRPAAEGLTKRIAGGAPFTVRFLFKEPFEFKPTFKLMRATITSRGLTASDVIPSRTLALARRVVVTTRRIRIFRTPYVLGL